MTRHAVEKHYCCGSLADVSEICCQVYLQHRTTRMCPVAAVGFQSTICLILINYHKILGAKCIYHK
jgi:hypothetical protein